LILLRKGGIDLALKRGLFCFESRDFSRAAPPERFVSGYAFRLTGIDSTKHNRLQALGLILGGAALPALRFEHS
jgi:hypothetical protein